LRGLVPGGCVLLCRNDRGGEKQLRDWVQQVADETGVKLASIEDAPPSLDYPRLAGFPESQSFAGVLLTTCE
jgi:23S rRNA G2069 N7-methylase RlmK/C1962 C5-methylase RlmI